MTAHVDQVLDVWREWGIQALVLFSLALQVALLILAEFRRRIDYGGLRFFIWSAYILADSTAVYVLGHLSVTSGSPRHQLMAFWAPFLLLHLGGQDNITAYAIEDNKLWLRHLQTFVVQVAAAAYVLYESSILNRSRGSKLWWATLLMFAAGAVKYAERVWALRCAGTNVSLSGKNYMSYGMQLFGETVYPDIAASPGGKHRDTKALLLLAHQLLDVPKDFLYGPLPHTNKYGVLRHMSGKDFYRLVEMELSLMHDVFYTKVGVMHTWCGLCIRVFLTLTTAAAFLLFYQNHNNNNNNKGQVEGYSGADITVTYVLLVGALVLEMISVLRAMLSSWTLASLLEAEQEMSFEVEHMVMVEHVVRRRMRMKRGKGEVLLVNKMVASMISHLRRLVHAANWRRRFYRSGSMGQHSLAQLSAQSKGSLRSKIARWMGVEDLWNTLAYSSSIEVPEAVKRLLYEASVGHGKQMTFVQLRNNTPTLTLGKDLLSKYLKKDKDIQVIMLSSLDEYIINWHIATCMYLDHWQDKNNEDPAANVSNGDKELARAVEALSHYMVFLLASRPYMLPPPVSRISYIGVCNHLIHGETFTYQTLDRAKTLGRSLNGKEQWEQWQRPEWLYGYENRRDSDEGGDEEGGGRGGANEVLVDVEEEEPHQEVSLKEIGLVWAEMLCYAGHKCSASSHAKQLSNGVELITIAALLVEHVFKEDDDNKFDSDFFEKFRPEWYDFVPSGNYIT